MKRVYGIIDILCLMTLPPSRYTAAASLPMSARMSP
jgi:hypothetical protein